MNQKRKIKRQSRLETCNFKNCIKKHGLIILRNGGKKRIRIGIVKINKKGRKTNFYLMIMEFKNVRN